MLKFTFLALLVLAALLVVAIKFLPWWACLLLIAALLLGVRYGFGYAIRRLLTLPFKAKGQVLSGAAVQVHEIRRAKPPVRKARPNAALYRPRIVRCVQDNRPCRHLRARPHGSPFRAV